MSRRSRSTSEQKIDITEALKHPEVLEKLDWKTKDYLWAQGLIPCTLDMLSIRTKDARLVRLIPNVVQQTLLEQWQETYQGFDWRRGALDGLKGARETILKARQEGVSTLIEALAYLFATTHKHWVSLIVADTRERAQMLFMMVSRFREHDPRDIKTKRENVGEIIFSDLDSMILVGTAGDKNVGRAATVNFLHMTELAFWGEKWNVRGGLLDAVPLESGIIFEETTANGVNEFYEHYEASRNGMTNFRARFVPWFALPEYRISTPGPITEEELLIMDKYSVDRCQARWYLMKRREKSTTDVPMEQEYPGTPEEAFVASASTNVFPVEPLKAMLTNAPKPKLKKEPGRDGIGGWLEIYEEPVHGIEYVIGADVAEGIHEGDHDYSTCDIFRADTWEQVASYWGRCTVDIFANDLHSLSAYYNDAILVVERNNHGYAVVLELEKLGAQLYYHRISQGRQPQPGFPSTAKTKALRDTALRNAIDAQDRYGEGVVLRSPRAIRELLNYRELPGHRRGAVGNSHDDHVTSCGLAVWYLAEHLPRIPPIRMREPTFTGYQPSWGRRTVTTFPQDEEWMRITEHERGYTIEAKPRT